MILKIMREKNEGIEFGKLDLSFTDNWDPVDVETFKIDRPVVFTFGGHGTEDRRKALGYCKLAKSLLGVFCEDADVIAVNYNNALKNIADDSKRLEILNQTMGKWFVPLIEKDGKRLPLVDACKNMRRVNILCHCFGAKVAESLEKLLSDKMQNLGYSTKETNQILEQIFVVSYASMVDDNKMRFKFLDVTSPEDDMLFVSGYWTWNKLLEKMGEVDFSPVDLEKLKKIKPKGNEHFDVYDIYENKERCFVFKEKNGLYLATTHLHKSDTYDHSICEMKRNMDWSAHKNASKAGDFVSRCLACALCHAVADSVLTMREDKLVPVNLEELKKEIESVVTPLNKETKDYLSEGLGK